MGLTSKLPIKTIYNFAVEFQKVFKDTLLDVFYDKIHYLKELIVLPLSHFMTKRTFFNDITCSYLPSVQHNSELILDVLID